MNNNYSNITNSRPIVVSGPCLLSGYRPPEHNTMPPLGECLDEGDSPAGIYYKVVNRIKRDYEKYVETDIQSKLINKIIAGKNIVEFEYSDREDLAKIPHFRSGPKKLSSITISYDGKCIKKFEFVYDYFISNDAFLEGINPKDRKPLQKRLKLEQVKEVTCNNLKEKIYQFVYNSTSLPHRVSYAQDKWGFFNGKYGNLSLFPDYYQESELPLVGSRFPNPKYAKTAMLEEIIYPTGGKVQFEYEGHKLDKRTGYYYKDEWKSELTVYSLHGVISGSSCIEVKDFALNPDKLYKMKISVNELADRDGVTGGTAARVFYGRYVENNQRNNYNMSTGNKLPFTNVYFYRDIWDDESCLNDGTSFNCHGSKEVLIPYDYTSHPEADALRIFAYAYMEGVGGATCLSCKVEILSKDVVFLYDIGGIRVKKITYKDADESIEREVTYSYDKPKLITDHKIIIRNEWDLFNMYRSLSGIIDSENIQYLINSRKSEYNNEIDYYRYGYYYVVMPEIDPFEYYFRGPHITYGNVTYTDGNGSTTKEFYPYNSYFELNGYSFPEKLPLQPKPQFILAGNIISESVQGEKNITTYAYSKDYPQIRAIHASTVLNGSYIVVWKPYFNFYTQKKMVTATINQRYFNDNFVEIRKKYQYGNKHNQPIKINTSTSKQDTIIQRIKYPPDVMDQGNPTVDKLIAQNRITTPIETQTLRNMQKLAKDKVEYDFFADRCLPKYVYAKKGEGNIDKAKDKKITYDRYDTQGNLLQYTPADGLTTSILWGYGGQYPVAKIAGATYDEAVAKLTTDEQTAIQNGSYNDDRLRNVLNKLRKLDAMVTTYTFKPLVGMTSATGPDGKTVYYEYDAFNRLKTTMDDKHNILKEIEYHYKGQ